MTRLVTQKRSYKSIFELANICFFISPKVGTNALDTPLLAETRAHGLGSDVRSPRNAPRVQLTPKGGSRGATARETRVRA